MLLEDVTAQKKTEKSARCLLISRALTCTCLATLGILVKNKVLTSQRRVKLDPPPTLGCHHTSSVGACFYVRVRSYRSRPLGGILSVCETPEQFRGLGNVSRASISVRG